MKRGHCHRAPGLLVQQGGPDCGPSPGNGKGAAGGEGLRVAWREKGRRGMTSWGDEGTCAEKPGGLVPSEDTPRSEGCQGPRAEALQLC